MNCPCCGQDDAADHTGCDAYLADRQTVSDALRAAGAPPRCADAAMYALGCAPAAVRVAVARAVIDAWRKRGKK